MAPIAYRIGLALLSTLVSPPVLADIYAYTDAAGAVSLSNVPGDERYRLLIAGPAEKAEPGSPPAGRDRVRAPRAAYGALIETASRTYGLSSALLHAVVSVESRYNAKAVSRRGARGLMQLMPGTALRYGVTDPFDPAQNLAGGARYLRDLLRRFDDDLSLALAAYNAGEGAVTRYGNRIPPYRETQAYVPQVVAYYRRYQEEQRAATRLLEAGGPGGGEGTANAAKPTARPARQLQGSPLPTEGFTFLQSRAPSLDWIPTHR